MSKKAHIFLERNFGNGYELAYPRINNWRKKFYIWLSKNCKEGRHNKFFHTIIKEKQEDSKCEDPHAVGRSPMITIKIVVFGNIHSKCKDNCISHALEITEGGETETLIVDVIN